MKVLQETLTGWLPLSARLASGRAGLSLRKSASGAFSKTSSQAYGGLQGRPVPGEPPRRPERLAATQRPRGGGTSRNDFYPRRGARREAPTAKSRESLADERAFPKPTARAARGFRAGRPTNSCRLDCAAERPLRRSGLRATDAVSVGVPQRHTRMAPLHPPLHPPAGTEAFGCGGLYPSGYNDRGVMQGLDDPGRLIAPVEEPAQTGVRSPWRCRTTVTHPREAVLRAGFCRPTGC